MIPSRSYLSTLLLLCGCGAQPTSGELAEVTLQMQASPDASQPLSMSSGWTITLHEAKVALGPLYVRAPRRMQRSMLQRILLPVAAAHPGHAQTLTEGQVVGEFLDQVVVDALGHGPGVEANVVAQLGHIERLSVVIDPPRTEQARAQLGKNHAIIQGLARKEGGEIPFTCGLRIDGDADEAPENLEARRRVDQVTLDDVQTLRQDSQLSLQVHVERWLELVDFDAFEPGVNPCGGDGRFEQQWYLGLRRPEAFSAALRSGATR